ncbi:Beta-L-arabinobiosidase precursor [Planctomycetes bacterium MalM25]|nr:Beta-L-arabinobiosidase precursor [Planctomycetes bacterium MalM25]
MSKRSRYSKLRKSPSSKRKSDQKRERLGRYEPLEPRQMLAGDAAYTEAPLDNTETVYASEPEGAQASQAGENAATVSGELRKWHKLTLDFEGPQTSESASNNPFMNYRLDVTFTHQLSGETYVVPGYFAADGDAGNSHATSGNIWRVHFAPDAIGQWNYTASFRAGTNVAVNSNPLAGSSAGFFDGDNGSFMVIESDKSGIDLRGKGRLEYVGEHYLQFAETGEYFLKQGPDAPENLFAYQDFDGNFKTDGQGDQYIKTLQPHVQDWNPGDPTWDSEDAGSTQDNGKGLIGAVNYLASEGLNAFSFLTMNITGDDKNVFPYTSYSERVRMDISKLDQWEKVLEHADHKGMYLHFKTQETENDQLLDGGALGNQRKLYYRELIARFSHHLALNWNLGEENTNTTQQQKDFAQFFYDNDPYRHNIVIHTYPGQQDQVYDPLLGNQSKLTGASVQTGQADFRNVHGDALQWVTDSAAAGKKWVVAVDEPGDAQHALRPDNDAGNSHVDGRKNALWGTLMAGGAGNEWYFGYGHAHSDLTLNDFRSRDDWWDYTRYALEFFNDNDIPFWEMQNDNNISAASNDYGFYKPGEVYVAYLKSGGTTNINLSAAAANETFEVSWYDPRNGGALQQGSVAQVTGGGTRAIGQAPNNTGQDWVVLLREPLIVDQGPFGEEAIELTDGTVIPFENYDVGGEGKAYHDTDAISQGDHSRAGGVDGGPEEGALGERIGWTADGEWLEYTVDATAGTYYASLRYSAGAATVGSVRLLIGGGPDGENFTELGVFDLQNTGSWTDWGYLTLPGVTIPAGDGQVLRAEIVGGGFDLDQIEFTTDAPVNAPPVVTIDDVTQVVEEASGEGVFQEQNGLVVMEMENTETTNLGLWNEETEYANYTGDGYLQFTGNGTASGPATSPLVYKFKINQAGLYYLHLRAARDTTNGQPGDHSNDAYVRVEGDYGAGPNAGNNHGDDAPLSMLKSNTKFYGGNANSFSWNSGNRLDPGGHDNKRVAVYDFKAGEEYTLVMSGRSKWFSVDRIVFRHASVGTGTAQSLSQPESDRSGGGPTGVLGYQIDATVTDDGRNFSPPELQWAMLSGPSGGVVGFDDPNAEDVFATFSVDGTYTLILIADDGEHTTWQTVEINASSTPNSAPEVEAGDDLSIKLPNDTVNLSGVVTDDGLPGTGLTNTWSVVSSPAGSNVSFGDDSSASTTATFDVAGDYVLRLTADDGGKESSDEVTVTVRSELEPIVLTPTDDAYLENSTTFNNEHLKVEDASRSRVSYLKFDIDGLEGFNVANATLRLNVNGDPGNGTVTAYTGSHSSWTESGLTTGNRPSAGAALGSVGGNHAEGQWKEFDVTNAVVAEGQVTFVVEIAAGNDVWFSSSEGAASPELVIEVAAVPTLTGDYDGNGVVEQADYDVWKASYGSTSLLDADGNEDGVVDAADYSIWRDNLGQSLPASEPLIQTIVSSEPVVEPEVVGPFALAPAVIAKDASYALLSVAQEAQDANSKESQLLLLLGVAGPSTEESAVAEVEALEEALADGNEGDATSVALIDRVSRAF